MSSDSQDFVAVYDEHVWDVYGFFGYRLSLARGGRGPRPRRPSSARCGPGGASTPSGPAPRTWLLAIAQNLLIDHYRRGARGQQEPLAEGELGGRPARARPRTSTSASGSTPELEAALGELDERERELIALRFGGDLSGPEIAELTGLTLANVQQILSRSLRRMRGDARAPTSAPGRPASCRRG